MCNPVVISRTLRSALNCKWSKPQFTTFNWKHAQQAALITFFWRCTWLMWRSWSIQHDGTQYKLEVVGVGLKHSNCILLFFRREIVCKVICYRKFLNISIGVRIIFTKSKLCFRSFLPNPIYIKIDYLLLILFAMLLNQYLWN